MNTAETNVETNAETKADTTPGWKSHPVNVRFSLPFFGRRFYFTMVAGNEQRSPVRIAEERAKHPVITVSNVLFGCGISTIFALLALVALAMQSSIIEL